MKNIKKKIQEKQSNEPANEFEIEEFNEKS